MNSLQFFLLSTILLFTLSAEASNFASVRDTDGRSLRPGQEYYIVPVIRGRGGGLTLVSHANDTCPLAVAQEIQELSLGLPVTFSPASPSDKFVKLSTDLNVEFLAASICVQSTVWQLGDVDAATGRRYVVSGGVKGKPGVGTVANWFKIDRYGDSDYKLVHCPSVCKICKVVCGDVGVFEEGGRRWLALSEEPFLVMFKSARPSRRS